MYGTILILNSNPCASLLSLRNSVIMIIGILFDDLITRIDLVFFDLRVCLGIS